MGTTRMVSSALRLALVVLAVSATWLTLTPQSAFGFVGSVIVLDSNADTTDHFFDNEPILAGVSVDFFRWPDMHRQRIGSVRQPGRRQLVL